MIEYIQHKNTGGDKVNRDELVLSAIPVLLQPIKSGTPKICLLKDNRDDQK